MDRDLTQITPRKGMEVFGSDSEKIGEVDEVRADHFVVRKGFFFPEDHYIPTTAIANQTEDGLYLDVTKNQALEQQWNVEPTGTADVGAADLNDVDEDRANIPVHEEELVTRKRDVDRGSVEIDKHVVEERAEADVPVTEEHVEVSRRPVDRDVEPGDNAFQEGTIEVPVHGEEVEVDKQARVVEEVDIDKTAETHTERVGDTVRREEVEIEGEEIDRNADRR